MRKVAVLLAAVFTFACASFAQNTPKLEVFGGYNYEHADSYYSEYNNGVGGHQNLNGWDVQATGFFKKNLGITADFSGASKDELGNTTAGYKRTSFLFGPTYALHTSHFTPFVHALFGVDRANAKDSGFSVMDNAFGMALGGGLDAGNQHFAVRLGQFDYLYSNHVGANQNDFRYSTGIVVRF